MADQEKRYGSLIATVIAGVILLGFFGNHQLFYFFIAAGIMTGIIARGPIKGIIASVASGAIVSGIVIGLAATGSTAAIAGLASKFYFSSMISGVFDNLLFLMNIPVTKLVDVLLIYGLGINGLGGFVGGAMHPEQE